MSRVGPEIDLDSLLPFMLNSIIQVTNASLAQVFGGAVERGIDAHRAADANAGLGARNTSESIALVGIRSLLSIWTQIRDQFLDAD
jgi:hypothetical protein